MKDNNPNHFLLGSRPYLLMVASLAGMVLACSLSLGSDQSVQETFVATNLQATIQAQEATQVALEQQNAQIAIQATQAALDRLKTEIAIQSTGAAEQTSPEPPPSAEPPTPTVAGTPTAEKPSAILLTQFSGNGWSFVQSAQCKDRQKGCWLGTAKANQINILTGRDQVFLDPA